MRNPVVPRPSKFKVNRENGRLILSQSWHNVGYYILIPMVAFMAFLVHTIVVKKAAQMQEEPFLWFVVAIIGLGALFLLYLAIGGIFNKTYYVVGNGKFSITHDPLPFGKNHEYPLNEIDQLYLMEYKMGEGSGSMYNLYLLKTDGEGVKLNIGFNKMDHALFVEDTLEKEMGLEYRPVAGEFKPS
ncbi:MAG: hypothetical protein AAFY71_12995 [Bacteroidota bacterium]